MSERDFLPRNYTRTLSGGSFSWQSPSNIALVKYWGKLPDQIPANPSVSFTLSKANTTTKLDFCKKEKAGDSFDFDLFLNQEKKESFRPKIQVFMERIFPYMPFLKDYAFRIETVNSFPHSSGIASSASGMSALALCLLSLEKELGPEMTEQEFRRKASFLARLGSGSACRSIEGPLIAWGRQQNLPGSSDLYGVLYPHPVHEIFRQYQDTILLVDEGEKQVSSSLGHQLMKGHPFAEPRFNQARQHLQDLEPVFREGDLPGFISIVEREALSLHAMMMSSDPYFLLMKPSTLEIIQKIFSFRRETGLHACFTLDAGANVHLLYPDSEKDQTQDFIRSELLPYCQKRKMISDHVGTGAKEVE